MARRIFGEQFAAPGSEARTLGDQVVRDEAEGPVSEDAGADVGVTGVAGAQAKGPLGEAMLGDVLVGGSEYRLLDGDEGPRCGRVVVRVEWSNGLPGWSEGPGGSCGRSCPQGPG